jgi:uncharacterized RDD family membrane protein YckC
MIIDKTMNNTNNIVGFWRRALAFILDLFIINLVIVSPFREMFSKYFYNGSLSQGLSQSLSFSETILPSNLYWAVFLIFLLALLYFAFFEYYLGQTPGMMLLRIKAISLKEKDGQIKLWSAIVRNCYILPFFPFYIFWIIEPLYLAFYKERLLEKITFTKTIYESESYKKNKHIYEEYKLNKV